MIISVLNCSLIDVPIKNITLNLEITQTVSLFSEEITNLDFFSSNRDCGTKLCNPNVLFCSLTILIYNYFNKQNYHYKMSFTINKLSTFAK